jgi:hypothetical protein
MDNCAPNPEGHGGKQNHPQNRRADSINTRKTSLLTFKPLVFQQTANLTVSQILSIENLLATRATWQCAGDRAGDGDADGGD